MIDRVVAQRVAEQPGRRTHDWKLSKPDEVVERLEAVPVVQAVAQALHDRIQHEHAVEQQRRQQEQRRPSATACGSGRRCDRRRRRARRCARTGSGAIAEASVGDVAVGAVTVQQRWRVRVGGWGTASHPLVGASYLRPARRR